MDQKRCLVCKETKGLDNFGRNKTKPGGLCGACFPCARASAKASYQRHKSQRQADARVGYWRDPSKRRQQATANKRKQPLRYAFYRKRGECRRHGLLFALGFADFASCYEQTECSACACLVSHRGRGQRNAWTLDKKVPALGYVPGNVAVLCQRCNTIKQDAGVVEVAAVLAYMKKGLQTEALSDGAGI